MGMSLRATTGASANAGSGSMGGNVSVGAGSAGRAGLFTSQNVLTASGMADLNALLMANPASRPLAQTAMADVQRLQQLNGIELDRTYMTRQVEMHQMTLDTMDRLLAQGAVSADMRPILTAQRATVAMHLQMAQQLRAQL
jgi:predicted outer membrane protein